MYIWCVCIWIDSRYHSEVYVSICTHGDRYTSTMCIIYSSIHLHVYIYIYVISCVCITDIYPLYEVCIYLYIDINHMYNRMYIKSYVCVYVYIYYFIYVCLYIKYPYDWDSNLGKPAWRPHFSIWHLLYLLTFLVPGT